MGPIGNNWIAHGGVVLPSGLFDRQPPRDTGNVSYRFYWKIVLSQFAERRERLCYDLRLESPSPNQRRNEVVVVVFKMGATPSTTFSASLLRSVLKSVLKLCTITKHINVIILSLIEPLREERETDEERRAWGNI